MYTKAIGALLVGIFLLQGCAAPEAPAPAQESISLFNGTDLTGWDTYIGPAVDSTGEKIPGTTLGLNNDPDGLFTVVEEDGEPAMRISGVRGAGISTVDEYGDYHLRLQYKWGDETPWTWMSRRDSGVLYHATGEHGVDNDYWMRSHEMQIMQTTSGDYIAIEGATAEIPSRYEEDRERYVYDPNGEMHTFSRQGFDPAAVAGAARITEHSDYPEPGRWTTVDLYVVGDTAVHVVNDKVQMALYNSRLYLDGQATPLTEGKIQLQSEGAEVFYRGFELTPITQLPEGLLEGN